LQNSAVTVNAGTGLSGGGSVALGSAITITNAGVTSVNGSTGAVTVVAYAGPSIQIITSSTTWTVPTGITRVKITLYGGGGGGGGSSVGGNGTSTSFGGYATAGYGGGGQVGGYDGEGGCNFPITNANGANSGAITFTALDNMLFGGAGQGGAGGNVYVGIGYPYFITSCGSSGGAQSNAFCSYISGLTSGSSISITIGAGGAGSAGYSANGQNGANGALVIEY
jgi:hypothetical protein